MWQWQCRYLWLAGPWGSEEKAEKAEWNTHPLVEVVGKPAASTTPEVILHCKVLLRNLYADGGRIYKILEHLNGRSQVPGACMNTSKNKLVSSGD